MDEDEDYDFGLWEAECYGCDVWTRVNDLGLCEDCDAKLDRDLIRQRDWDYSASAFGVPPEKLEELRTSVVKEYGEQLELIIERQPKNQSIKKSKTKKKKRNKRY
ncbi:MAG: hypothetical protein HUU50_21555 [Candidatus Brocadiae bacterium]|nr:hypothetical protein [Candidatus Brocadiia bacterium]